MLAKRSKSLSCTVKYGSLEGNNTCCPPLLLPVEFMWVSVHLNNLYLHLQGTCVEQVTLVLSEILKYSLVSNTVLAGSLTLPEGLLQG
jgi:hypothetical protein